MNQPVIVAGGGPVGLMLACELGLAGVETIVLEQLGEPSGRSRGTAINAAVVELLAQRGLMDRLRETGIELPLAHFAHIFMNPKKIHEPHPYTFAVPHSSLEQALAQRAVELGVDVRRGTEVCSLEQDETGIVAGACSGPRHLSIRGCFLVGCDGAESTVRALAQIGFPGTDYRFYGITGDVAVEPGDPLFTRLGIHQHAAGFVTVAPVAPQVLRVTTGEFDREPGDGDAPVSTAEFRAHVERISEVPLTTGTVRWLARWNTPSRQADRYRADRVFLAGDAAHVHFPLGGLPLSTGIEDAMNLGWKLAADIHGWAPPGLLDTYQTERHPVGARVSLTTRAQAALLQHLDRSGPLRDILTELIQFEDVNEYLVRMVSGLDVRYPMEDAEQTSAREQPHPLVGRRLPSVSLATATGDMTVAQLLHSGRGVLLDLSEGALADDAAAGWAGRVKVTTAKSVSEIAAAALLIRPDGRVAWAAADPADAAGLRPALRAWFGEPVPTAAAGAGLT